MKHALSSSVLASLLLALPGCGGTAVVERESGSGGAGGAGSSTSQAVTTADVATVGTSHGTGTDCDALGAAMRTTLEAATACNACADFDGCIVPAILHDDCDCEVHGNGAAADLVDNATQAFDAWVAAGCGPNKCGKLCPPVSSNGFCATDGAGSCQGHCSGG